MLPHTTNSSRTYNVMLHHFVLQQGGLWDTTTLTCAYAPGVDHIYGSGVAINHNRVSRVASRALSDPAGTKNTSRYFMLVILAFVEPRYRTTRDSMWVG
jgi:hypothetical protein